VSEMQKILVSACLLGARVRYHGGDARLDDPLLSRWAAEERLVPICPEVDAGLSVPRAPVEVQGAGGGRAVVEGRARVRTAGGEDLTATLVAGAERALDAARRHGARIAILKEGSPSCAATTLYDGSFSGVRIAGEGVTAARLAAAGIAVFGERDLAAAAAWIEREERLDRGGGRAEGADHQSARRRTRRSGTRPRGES